MATIKAKVTPQNNIRVTNYQLNASSIRLSDLFDVSSEQASDGSVLIYNGLIDSWEPKRVVENRNTEINGGEF